MHTNTSSSKVRTGTCASVDERDSCQACPPTRCLESVAAQRSQRGAGRLALGVAGAPALPTTLTDLPQLIPHKVRTRATLRDYGIPLHQAKRFLDANDALCSECNMATYEWHHGMACFECPHEKGSIHGQELGRWRYHGRISPKCCVKLRGRCVCIARLVSRLAGHS
ncbi:hypothetical protein BD310DRAFT_104959 [Dichomitus squalens]|uniref:Uncharacterized protein n=1 Tax=Dichomitus squalens TaxID=114155 RepID=A0A4Q9PJ41_9APHY|nr:hypothetical protein BD310DRAFT_104959 [Dichomitus squalens]